MIFVTVGTHEQPFDRLVSHMDRLKKDGIIAEEVIIQTGFSTYEPEYCTFSRMYSYQEMMEMMDNARIIVTHGGPSSFMTSLQKGKIPVVVPRQKQFGEHVNDHQSEFSRAVAERYKNIIVVENILDMRSIIKDYDYIIKKMSVGVESNNRIFNKKLSILVQELLIKSSTEERH